MIAKNTIHLGLTFDQNYVTLFYVLLTSVFANNGSNKIVIHAIATGVGEKEKAAIIQFVNSNNGEIMFYEFDEEAAANLSLNEGKHLTAATYYRLYLPALVPDSIGKLLYLDTDIVVIGNLLPLYNTNLEGVPAAAVNYPDAAPRPELGIEREGEYFNAGVLLINLSIWKSQHISRKTIAFVQQNPEKCRLNDQDGLNAVLLNNYHKLQKRYNITLSDIPEHLRKKEYKTFLSDKVIIHYTRGGHKPWRILNKNKFRHLYHYYLEKSPRKGEQKYSDFNLHPKTLLRFVKIRVEESIVSYPLIHKYYKKSTHAARKVL